MSTIIKHKNLVILALVVTFAFFLSKNTQTDLGPIERTAWEAAENNPFFGLSTEEDLKQEIQVHLIRRLNEGIPLDQIKEEIRSYIAGAKIAEKIIVDSMVEEILQEESNFDLEPLK